MKISFATILVMLQHPGPPGKLVRQKSCKTNSILTSQHAQTPVILAQKKSPTFVEEISMNQTLH